MPNPSYKFEFSLPVVQYLLQAVDTQQIRGEKQAKDLVAVLGLLRNPTNAEDFEKEQLESLKAKYEPVVEEEEASDK